MSLAKMFENEQRSPRWWSCLVPSVRFDSVIAMEHTIVFFIAQLRFFNLATSLEVNAE